MQFNSFIFLIFISLFFLFWNKLNNKNCKWAYLIFASFLFYGYWDWRFLFLIIFSGSLDFVVGILINRYHKYRALLLSVSIIGNIGSLSIFKYSQFIAENLGLLLGLELVQYLPEFTLITPIGISFYTFQSMSYTIDIYRGKLKPVKNPLLFFAYLSMFPQLVAGPIIRAKTLIPQLKRSYSVSQIEYWNGFKLIIHGFFKKIVLADNIAPMVNYAFANEIDKSSGLYWWLIISGFSFQIYYDFSGYTDIARGIAKTMGFHFKMNFNHPYSSKSLREFWTKWHISLSHWFRDYVYIPLGGNKFGETRSHVNMWITMILSGIWHGAAWTFIIWGAIHAFFITIERITKWQYYVSDFKLGKYFVQVVVLIQVWVAWVFFRATNYTDAITIINNMFFPNDFLFNFRFNERMVNGCLFLMLAILYEGLRYQKLLNKKNKSVRMIKFIDISIIVVLLIACFLLRGPASEFIYFQF